MTASRPVRLGVAGLGRAFTLMLPTFLRDPRVRLVAACDPRPEALARFQSDFGGSVYSSIEQLALDQQVEAIYIASPHQFHAAQTRTAASHGKHVLVEKPMALTLADCDAMVADCRAAGVHLIVGHCHSFDSPYLKARDLIAQGRLGRVRMIHALNYTDFLYRPRRPEELKTETGGGVVFSQAAHQVDIVRLLAGSEVVRVRAVTGTWDPARPTEGAYAALLWFANGAFASITYSGYGHFDTDEWCSGVGEMGSPKPPDHYGGARRLLSGLGTPALEAAAKAQRTYGSAAFRLPAKVAPAVLPLHQHFGPVVVSCDHADLRPVPKGVWLYGDTVRELIALPAPAVPRFEVIDELHAAVVGNVAPLHSGRWARETLQVCLALLASARAQGDVELAIPAAGAP